MNLETDFRDMFCMSIVASESPQMNSISSQLGAKPMQNNAQWLSGIDAWRQFVHNHPELGYRVGKWGFHNFLRHFREPLARADAIRLAKKKFWIAHPERFSEVAFECATGTIKVGGAK
jgi:hypothetical protein